MVILSVDLNNINLGGVNFYKDDPKTIIHVRHMTWRNRLKQHKAFKKDISKDYCMEHGLQQEGGIGACQTMRIKE